MNRPTKLMLQMKAAKGNIGMNYELNFMLLFVAATMQTILTQRSTIYCENKGRKPQRYIELI